MIQRLIAVGWYPRSLSVTPRLRKNDSIATLAVAQACVCKSTGFETVNGLSVNPIDATIQTAINDEVFDVIISELGVNKCPAYPV